MTEKPPSEPKRQHCSVCGFDNPEGVLNCQNCGTPLVSRTLIDSRKPTEPPAGKPTFTPVVPTLPESPQPPAPPSQPPTQEAPAPAQQPTPAQQAPAPAAEPPAPAQQPPAPVNRPAAQLSESAPTEPSLKRPASPQPPPPGAPPQPATPGTSPASPVEQPPDTLSPPSAATLQDKDETATPGRGTNQYDSPIRCPRCGHYNRPGTLVCDNCGTNLQTGEHPKLTTAALGDKLAKTRLNAAAEAGTKPLNPQPIVPHLSTEEIRAVQTAGADLFEDDMILRLEVSGAPTPILVYPTVETIIGRRDPISSGVPDVDLTAYAGYRMGVSRQHAVLRLQSKVLDIRDLGSSNGTFVNGVRLSPHQPHLLRDGDEIGLGKMVLKVFFQSGARRRSAADLTPPP